MAKGRSGIELKHVNHVVYMVRDTSRSLAFYRDILGIREIPKMVESEHVTWLQLPSGVMVHLVETDQVPASDRLHTAFEVADFDGTVQALTERGITIERSGQRLDGQRFLYIRDPDSNRVELCTPSGF